MAMTVATQIQAVGVAWLIYELTHDPLSVELIGLAEAVPFIAPAAAAEKDRVGAMGYGLERWDATRLVKRMPRRFPDVTSSK